MTPEIAFARAYHAVTLLIASNPALMEFAGWPVAMPNPKPRQRVPAADLVKAWAEGRIDATISLHDAVRDLTDFADWQQTYSLEEVGADFLNRYGWFELVGPTGHYRSDEMRAYIAFWGENLYYSWHLHEAEELYFIIAGEAEFAAEGLPTVVLRAGDFRVHTSNQPHAMTTHASPVLALVLWRGRGLTGVPRMGTA